MLHTKFQGHRSIGSGAENFLRFFTMYGHGGNLGLVTLLGMVGWCDGAGLTSSAGAYYNFDYSRAMAYCACSRCGWGCLDIFILTYHFSPLSPSLWEMARYRLKYCLKGPLNPKQPTN